MAGSARAHFREELHELEVQALGALDMVVAAARPHAGGPRAPGHRAGRDRGHRRRPHRRALPRGPPGDPLAARAAGAGGQRPAHCRGAAARDQARRAHGRPVREHRQAAAGRRATSRRSTTALLERIMRMGALARSEVSQAKQAFALRDVDARRGPRAPGRRDQPAQPRDLPDRPSSMGTDADRREWAMTMMLVARAIERIGDNAVDIGEQVAFVVTGLFREFSDASHGVRELSRSRRSERDLRSGRRSDVTSVLPEAGARVTPASVPRILMPDMTTSYAPEGQRRTGAGGQAADPPGGARRRHRLPAGARQAAGERGLAAPRPGVPGAARRDGLHAAERRGARPRDPRPAGLDLPRAALRAAPAPRRGRLHRPVDRRAARPRPAARRRRLGHQALPSRGADRARRGRRAPPQARRGPRGRQPGVRRRGRDPRRPVPGLRRTASPPTSPGASSSSSSCSPTPRARCSRARRSTSASGATRWSTATARSTSSCASCARSSSASRRTGATSTRTSGSATASPRSRRSPRRRLRRRRRPAGRGAAGAARRVADEPVAVPAGRS